MKPIIAVTAIAALLAGCAQREDPSDVAAAQASGASSDPSSTEDINETPDTTDTAPVASIPEGSIWQDGEVDGTASAVFGPAEGDPQLALACDNTRREIIFTRYNDIAAGEVDMRIGTGAQIKVFPAEAEADPPRVVGRLSVNDRVLLAIPASSEPMSIQIGDGDTLLAPAGEALAQVIKSCG